MKGDGAFRTCPGCRQRGLASTGAFLRCGMCGYAITAQALAREPVGAPSDSRASRKPLRETA
jgi:hypothetical protein